MARRRVRKRKLTRKSHALLRIDELRRGRVALPRDRRCTSENFPWLIALPQSFGLFSFYERATPVAQERDHTRLAATSSSSIFDLELVWIWECGVEGVAYNARGVPASGSLQRVEDEDEDEGDLVAATPR